MDGLTARRTARSEEEVDMTSQRIAIVGAGPNRAGIGADLARARLDVTFIKQWRAHVEAMGKNDVRIVMPDETLVTLVRV